MPGAGAIHPICFGRKRIFRDGDLLVHLAGFASNLFATPERPSRPAFVSAK